MITDRVTLFGQFPGEVISLEGGDEVLVYSPVGLDGTKLRPKRDKRLSVQLGAVSEVLRERGGLSMRVDSEGGIRIEAYPTERYQPPNYALRLSPAGHGEFLSCAKAGVGLGAAAHLIVPTDAEADEKLRQFEEVLAWFPGDRAITIRQIIRGPSLDWRLAQLEARLDRRPEPRTRSVRAWPTWLRLPESRFWWWSAVSVAMVLLAAALWAGSLYVAAWIHPSEAPVTDVGVSPQPQPTETEANKGRKASGNGNDAAGSGAGSGPAADTALYRALAGLRDELRDGQGPIIRTLRATHFTALDTADPGDLPRDPGFAWGIVKLELRRSGHIDAQNSIFADPTLETPTRELVLTIFGYNRYREFTKVSDETRAMLAYVGCKAWRVPGLPERSRDNPELRFESRCDSVSEERAAKGFNSLAAFLAGARQSNAAGR